MNNVKLVAEDEMRRLDKKILDMITKALSDESQAVDYYSRLINKIENPKDKEIVRGIMLDEKKHFKYLNEIYKKLTGRNAMNIKFEPKPVSDNLVKDFEDSLFDELEAFEFYRTLMFAFLDLQIRDTIFEIMTDEQEHATKFNFLYSKYKK